MSFTIEWLRFENGVPGRDRRYTFNFIDVQWGGDRIGGTYVVVVAACGAFLFFNWALLWALLVDGNGVFQINQDTCKLVNTPESRKTICGGGCIQILMTLHFHK